MSRLMGWLLLCMVSGAIHAGGTQDVIRQVELSTLAIGSIDVDANGSVVAYSLDDQDKLPVAVVEMAAKHVPHWKFDKAAPNQANGLTRSHMSIRFVARQVDENNYAVRIASAGFFWDGSDAAPVGREQKPPRYPRVAAMKGATGTVYVLAKVGPDGRVSDAAAEQINLKVITDEAGMTIWRAMFEKASLEAARNWRFPPNDAEAGAPYWVARVPVDFLMRGQTLPAYGQWDAYVPGPRRKPDWASDEDVPSGGPDALPSGRSYSSSKQLRLLSPLQGTDAQALPSAVPPGGIAGGSDSG